METCKKHRRQLARLLADIEGWLLKHPEAPIPVTEGCVICEAP